MTASQQVGISMPRVDVEAKVTGRVRYGVDLSMSGMLTGRFLRAGVPHARIVSIDVSEAWRVPGVRAVVTGQDYPRRHGPLVKDQPGLAVDVVRYAGEVVAAVAADNPEAADEALERIVVEYAPLPVLASIEDSLVDGCALLHPDYDNYERLPVSGIRVRGLPGTNVPYHFKLRRGDVERAFDDADVVVEGDFSTQFVQYAHLEPHVAIAQFDQDGALTVWEPTMGPHTLRGMLADFCDLPLSKVRVITPPVGGAFGAKMYLRALNPVVVLLARQVPGRPVRVVFDREDEFLTSPGRLPARIKLRTAATADGTITARQATIYWEQGAYVDLTPIKVRNSGYVALGPYRIEHASVDGYLVYTNRQPGGAFRGLGVPQVAWAGEQQIDELAIRLGMDPIDLRLRNLLRDGDTSVTGEVMRDVGAEACLVAAREAMSRWPDPPRGVRVGRGCAIVLKSTLTPTVTFGAVRMNFDGSIDIFTAAVEHGQGVRTILTQMVAEELAVDPSIVRIAETDTQTAPFDRSSTSSRTTFSMGNAIRSGAIEIRRQLVEIAADVFEVAAEDIKLNAGTVCVRGVPATVTTYRDLLHKYFKGPSNLIGQGEYGTYKSYDPMDPDTGQSSFPSAFWAYGAAAAEVEVDNETGQVRVRRLTTIVDAGKAINPATCKQQITGSAVMGLGLSLMEKVHFEDGIVLNPTLLDYKLPTLLDMPDLESVIVETADHEGPYGARGVGEVGVAPVPAAIGNAVRQVTGVRLTELPMYAEQNLRKFRGVDE